MLWLTVGIGLIALALVVVALGFVGDSKERAGVSRSLAAIEGYGVSPEAARQRDFSERVLHPLAGRLGNLGTALTPRGAISRLQRHLDYAGNPAGWPVERVVAAKGVGLVIGFLCGLGFGV